MKKKIKNSNNNLKKEEEKIIFNSEFNKQELNINTNSSKRNYNIYNKGKLNNNSRNKSFKSQDIKK